MSNDRKDELAKRPPLEPTVLHEPEVGTTQTIRSTTITTQDMSERFAETTLRGQRIDAATKLRLARIQQHSDEFLVKALLAMFGIVTGALITCAFGGNALGLSDAVLKTLLIALGGVDAVAVGLLGAKLPKR